MHSRRLLVHYRSTPRIACAVWLCSSALSASPCAAQTQLDRLFPAAASIGSVTSLKAEGKFPKWPPSFVCDRTDVQVSAGEASGELSVTIEQDALPGVAWLRMHDDTSASGLVPLLIEPIEVNAEVEPNNRIAEAMAIANPSVISGRLQKSGDVDTFRIYSAANQTLVVSLIANRVLRSPMDAVMQLVDGRGNVLMQTDDDCGLDPQLVFPVPKEGEWWIRVFAFPETPNSTIGYSGDSSFVYVLRATGEGFVDHWLPLVGDSGDHQPEAVGWNLPEEQVTERLPATGVSPATLSSPNSLGWQWQPAAPSGAANLVEPSAGNPSSELVNASHVPFVFSGHIGQPGEVDRVRFPVAGGRKVRVSIESKRFGFLLDSVARLVNAADGTELARNDDRGPNVYDAAFEYESKSDGEVELLISDLVDGFGPRHAYSAIVEVVGPMAETLSADLASTMFGAEVASDRFLVKAGETVEIPVTLSRRSGFDGRLQVTAGELPPGVTAEPLISETKGDSSKSVKLKLTATSDANFQGEIHLAIRTVDSVGKPSGAQVFAAFPLREEVRLTNLWLTVVQGAK